jgi:anti-sigma factor RsiW
MEHESCRDLISLDADGRLPEADRPALEAHLGGCADCRLFADGVRAASSVIAGQEPPPRSEAFVQSVLRRLPEPSRDDLPMRWLVPAFSAAFAVAVFVWTPTIQAYSANSFVVADASPILDVWGDER